MQATLSLNRTPVFGSKQLSSKPIQRSYKSRSICVVAASAVPPPKGVTQPPVNPVKPPPMFGFVYNAEKYNSRAAMIGFFSLLLLEGVTGKGILELMGYTVGQGLNLNF